VATRTFAATVTIGKLYIPQSSCLAKPFVNRSRALLTIFTTLALAAEIVQIKMGAIGSDFYLPSCGHLFFGRIVPKFHVSVSWGCTATLFLNKYSNSM
jgi:hypothetical protein